MGISLRACTINSKLNICLRDSGEVSERGIMSLEVEDNLLRLSLQPQWGERVWRPQHICHTCFESSFAGHSPLVVQKPGDT